MVDVDLTTKYGPLTLRNPIMPASCEIILTPKDVKKCIDQGVGGIVTKSYVDDVPLINQSRPRPFAFPLRRFGPALRTSWLMSGGFVLGSPIEKVVREYMPKMVKLCRESETPLIVSLANLSSERSAYWAKRFEEEGADAIEMDLQCPHVVPFVMESMREKGIESVKILEQFLSYTTEFVKTVKESLQSIPLIPKMGIMFPYDPVEMYGKAWTNAGADMLVGHGGMKGIFIDAESEEPFGLPGIRGYIAGRAMLPFGLGRITRLIDTVDVPVCGVGGIFEPMDALQYLLVGCRSVEVGSAVYHIGYGVFKKLVNGVEDWMARKGYSTTDEFIGKALKAALVDFSRYEEILEIPWVPPEERTSPVIPQIDKEKCTSCAVCIRACMYDVYEMDADKNEVKVDYENKCTGCGMCVGLCPVEAITLIDKGSKEIVWNNKGLVKPFKRIVEA